MNKKDYSFKDMLNSEALRNTKDLTLPILLGNSNKASILDLIKRPHLFIAGSQGCGKTNFLHSTILSLLCHNSFEQVKLLLINLKIEEYAIYNDTPYLLAPVISSEEKAVGSLLWCIKEMERRYSLLSSACVRNITDYNSQTENKLPHIVIIIDEYSPILRSEYSLKFEEYVMRIIHQARAVGMHLIMSTNDISPENILPAFKVCVPIRIAFSTESDIESQLILDKKGAEKLEKVGHMICSIFVDTHLPPTLERDVVARFDEQDNYLGKEETGNIVFGRNYIPSRHDINIHTDAITTELIDQIKSQLNTQGEISYIEIPKV